jgi:hypothetical protein
MTKYTHKSGGFPDYAYVECDGERVWGVTHAGNRVLTGWLEGAAELFERKGLWVRA